MSGNRVSSVGGGVSRGVGGGPQRGRKYAEPRSLLDSLAQCWLWIPLTLRFMSKARANFAQITRVAPEMLKFQRHNDSVVILNEWTFVRMLITNVMQPLRCTYLTQWPQESSCSRWPSKMSSENHLKRRHFHFTDSNCHLRGWIVSSTNDSSGTDTHASSRLRSNPLSSLYFFHEQGAIFKLLTRGSFHESGDDLVSTERGLDITETDNTDAQRYKYVFRQTHNCFNHWHLWCSE